MDGGPTIRLLKPAQHPMRYAPDGQYILFVDLIQSFNSSIWDIVGHVGRILNCQGQPPSYVTINIRISTLSPELYNDALFK